MKKGTDALLWSSVGSKKKYSNISQELLSQLHSWIPQNPNIYTYPLYRDMLWWEKEDGTRDRISKILITISIREIRNQMIKPAEEGGLLGVKDKNGKVLFSDTALRDNFQFNLQPIQ